MELDKVPQILGMLGLTSDQIRAVNDASRSDDPKYKGHFAGDVAAQMFPGIVTREKLDNALIRQSADKATAASHDMATIVAQGQQNHPPFLKANWGNNGVNKPNLTDPPAVAGASAAANIAQNLTMVANDHPELAHDPAIRAAVNATAQLTHSIQNGTPPLTPGELHRAEEQMKAGIKDAAKKFPLNDAKGNPIDPQEYITTRFSEIDKAAAEKCVTAEKAPPAHNPHRPNETLHTGDTVDSHVGSTGNNVRIAGTMLNKLGFGETIGGSKGAQDGAFGDNMALATKQFQDKYNADPKHTEKLVVNGEVDGHTWDAMTRSYQEASGLKPTGNLDPKTQAYLRVDGYKPTSQSPAEHHEPGQPTPSPTPVVAPDQGKATVR